MPEGPRVLYFGSYDRGPGRNRILMAGLRAAGVSVVEHHAEVWADTGAKLAAFRGPLSLARALLRQGKAWGILASRLGAVPDCDAIVVGATAHADLPLARCLARRRGVPLVFDPLVSATETVRDRGLLGPAAPALALLLRWERWLFSLPDMVLVDTCVHGAAWQRELGLPVAKAERVPAGSPPAMARVPDYRPHDGRLRVLYFGQYIPLHGLPIVVDAAAMLRHREIDFVFAGRGQLLSDIRDRAAALGLHRVVFDDRWRTPAALAGDHLAAADVCLGAFGDQPKARRVVPFKVYAAMAAGRAVVTGDTEAARELLRPGEVITVPPADPVALAAALARLAAAPEERLAIARRGRRAFGDRFSGAALGARAAGVMASVVARHEVGHHRRGRWGAWSAARGDPSIRRRRVARATLGALAPRRGR